MPKSQMNRQLSSSIRTLLSQVGVTTVGRSIHGRTYRVPLACTSLRHLLVCKDEPYEGAFYNYILHLASPGAVVFDIGAHLGKYIIGLAERIQPSGSIIAFEANPTTARYLKQIVELNDLSRLVTVINAAVADAKGNITLKIRGDGCDCGQTIFEAGGESSSEIEVTTVDDFVSKSGLCPNLLKIDVEGCELKVLQGAIQTLRNGAPAVCCEIHPRNLAKMGCQSSDVKTFLSQQGYFPLAESAFQKGDEQRPYNLVFRKGKRTGL